MTLEELLEHFDEPALQADGSWKALCRAHGDHNASLHITVKEDEGNKVVVKCFTGCEQDEILKAQGLWGMHLFVDGRPGEKLVKGKGKKAGVPPGKARTRAAVYSDLLSRLTLTQAHAAGLRERGLSDADLERNAYRSLDCMPVGDLAYVYDALVRDHGALTVEGCPGLDRRPARPKDGFLVPFRKPDGSIQAFQVRTERGKSKYLWFGKGVEAEATCHVPLACGGLWKDLVRVTEGALKADVVMALDPALPTIGVPGVANWKACLPVLRHWQTRTVRIAFDSDWKENLSVLKPLRQLEEELRASGFRVELETWDQDWKGLDDLLLDGDATPQVLAGVDVRDALYPSDGMHGFGGLAMEPIEWLWERWVPVGAVTMLDGDPGVAKSTLTYWLASQVSTGGEEVGGKVGKVLIVNCEDDPARVMKPRLVAAGADLDNVAYLTHLDKDRHGNPLPIQFPDQIDRLGDHIDKLKPRLVVIDPIMAYLSMKIDTGKDQHVRQPLNRLHQLAESRRIAMVLVRHLTKNRDQQASHRGQGSIGFTGVSRSCIMMTPHPEDPDNEGDKRVVGVYKTSYGQMPPSRVAVLKNVPVGGVGDAVTLTWEPGTEGVYHPCQVVRQGNGAVAQRQRQEEMNEKVRGAKGKVQELLERFPTITKKDAVSHLGIREAEFEAAVAAIGWAKETPRKNDAGRAVMAWGPRAEGKTNGK